MIFQITTFEDFVILSREKPRFEWIGLWLKFGHPLQFSVKRTCQSGMYCAMWIFHFCTDHERGQKQGKSSERNIPLPGVIIQPVHGTPPSQWLRFVDDTFVITKAEHSQILLNTSTTRIYTSSSQLKNHHSRAHFNSWTP